MNVGARGKVSLGKSSWCEDRYDSRRQRRSKPHGPGDAFETAGESKERVLGRQWMEPTALWMGGAAEPHRAPRPPQYLQLDVPVTACWREGHIALGSGLQREIPQLEGRGERLREADPAAGRGAPVPPAGRRGLSVFCGLQVIFIYSVLLCKLPGWFSLSSFVVLIRGLPVVTVLRLLTMRTSRLCHECLQ